VGAALGHQPELARLVAIQHEVFAQQTDGSNRIGIQLGGSAAPGVTPDRSKTFDRGASADEMEAEGSTPGVAPVLGHLRSVVGLVWRSVVLWMLLLALLSLANVVG